MPYRLDDLDPAADAVRGVARDRLAHAAAALVDGGGDAVAVHTARKDLKKTRSLLRLARPGLPRKAYRARNAELRDAARSLESAREAEALAGAVEDLAAHTGGRLMPEALADLAAALRAAAPADSDADRAAHAQAVAARLTALAAAVDAWPLDGLTAAGLVTGLADGYARGRTELAAARRDPTSVVLHEWRKRVKDLWYHARLLRPAAPGVLAPLIADAGALADHLGDEHDLAVLIDRLDAADPSVAGVVVDEPALRAVVADRRAALREQAGTLAARLYAEKPAALHRRIDAAVRPRPVAFTLPAPPG